MAFEKIKLQEILLSYFPKEEDIIYVTNYSKDNEPTIIEEDAANRLSIVIYEDLSQSKRITYEYEYPPIGQTNQLELLGTWVSLEDI